MNEQEIKNQLESWLDKWDVQLLLNQVITDRIGRAEAQARNQEFLDACNKG